MGSEETRVGGGVDLRGGGGVEEGGGLRKGWIERVRGWDEKGKMSEGVREECFIEFSEIKI